MTRLPAGIFKRPDRPGFYVRDQRGGKDRWRKAGGTVKEARAFRDKIRGEEPAPDRMTVEVAAARWLALAIATTRNERGQRLAKARVDNDLIPFFKYRTAASLTADDCRAYRLAIEAGQKKKGRGKRSPQTVAHLLSDLRCMLEWAKGSGIVSRSPFPRGLMPRLQERPPDRLTDEEVDLLLALPGETGFYLRLLLGTGIRWGEAARAEARHIERGHLVLSQTKSGRVRRVPLSPALEQEIRSRVGRLVGLVNAQSLAARARDAVPRFHVHMTRHTFACRWLEGGGSITALKEIMGHASVLTTQRYGRPNEDAIRREAELVRASEK